MSDDTKYEPPKEVKWRNSTYVMEREEEGTIYWYNPVSRFKGQCSVNAWSRSDPYDGQIQ
jgi:hypothetical protein